MPALGGAGDYVRMLPSAPASTEHAYLDTSTEPPTLQVWDGSSWVLASGGGGGGGGSVADVPTEAESGTGWVIPANSLDNYRVAKAAAIDGDALLEVAFVGDSTFAGQTNVYSGDGSDTYYSPITRLRELFATTGADDGGHGHVNGVLDFPIVSGESAPDAGVVLTQGFGGNGNATYNLPGLPVVSELVGDVADYVVYGSHIRIFYTRLYLSGRFSYSLDGDTPVIVEAYYSGTFIADFIDLPGLTDGRHTVQIVNLGGRSWTPPPTPIDQGATAGTLAAGTYYYKVTGDTADGETNASTAVAVTLSSTGGRTLATPNTGYDPDFYNVYRSATLNGTYGLLASHVAALGNGQFYWTDDGSLSPNGAVNPPTGDEPVEGTPSYCNVAVDAIRAEGVVLHNFGLRVATSNIMSNGSMEIILGLSYDSSASPASRAKDPRSAHRHPKLGVFNYGLNDQGLGTLDGGTAATAAAALKAKAILWCQACRAADCDPIIVVPQLEAAGNASFASVFRTALVEAADEQDAAMVDYMAAIGPMAGWAAAGYGDSADPHLSVLGYRTFAAFLWTNVLSK